MPDGSTYHARQEPTFLQLNHKIEYTEADQALPLLADMGLVPMRWQVPILEAALARDKNDKYLYRELGLSVPRQNGKSFIVRAICAECGLVNDERIAYTAHRNDTADEMFREVCSTLESDELPGYLSAAVKTIRKSNGQWAIYFKGGGYIKFTTRSSGLGRGRGFDRLIIDEAQELTSAELAAMLPTLSANKNKNSQTIYLGTPPGPECKGDVFDAMHDSVHSGKSLDTAWFEWSVDEPGDKLDRARWFETNPSLDDLLDLEAVRIESERFDSVTFARERLGWWADMGSYEKAINKVAWERCEVDMAPQCGTVAYGIKFSADGSHAALCAAALEEGMLPHVELVKTYDVTHGMARLAADLAGAIRVASCFMADGKGSAETLAQRVMAMESDAGPDYCRVAKTKDVIQAASGFADAVLAHEITHVHDDALTESVCWAAKRPIGKDAWGLGDAGKCDSTAAQAASLALLAVQTTTRDPNHVQEVAFF